jgi:hypothetical protein
MSERAFEAWLHAVIDTAAAGVWAVAWLMRDPAAARRLLVELERSREAAENLMLALHEAVDALRGQL